MGKPFHFKEFTIHQEKTAMKVGTDGVLLGAWCAVDFYPDAILDIGAGTGLISLMLAQRSDAMTIDAVEIDENAYEQTVENFEQSDWADRLYCYHATFQEFADELEEEEETYDLIISNPPFYNNAFETEDDSRNKARYTSSLSFEDLLSGVAKLISDNGQFATVIPFAEEKSFIEIASKLGLLVKRICRVNGTPTSEIKRSLIEFSKVESKLVEEELVIEISRHNYTDAYKELTRDFYLKM